MKPVLLLFVAAGAAAVLSSCGDDEGATSDTRACDAEPEVLTTEDGVAFVRTPDACFDDLPDWPYEPHTVEIDGLRQVRVDEGLIDGKILEHSVIV